MDKNIRKKDPLVIGIISDTHGLLRPEAVDALQGSDMIIHAGDIGRKNVLDGLGAIAPVIAVRGNMDREDWSYKFRMIEVVELNKFLLYMIHDLGRLDLDPAVSHIKIVVSGHSHRPSISRHKGVLYINPGSAGPKRFTLPVSVALLRIEGETFDAQIVELDRNVSKK
jgi:putative phosphoesterase